MQKALACKYLFCFRFCTGIFLLKIIPRQFLVSQLSDKDQKGLLNAEVYCSAGFRTFCWLFAVEGIASGAQEEDVITAC